MVVAQQVTRCVAELPQSGLLSDYVLRQEWLQPLACAWREVRVACGPTLALGSREPLFPATSLPLSPGVARQCLALHEFADFAFKYENLHQRS